MHISNRIFFLSFLLWTSFSIAQGIETKEETTGKCNDKNRNSLVALPYAFYSPETKVAVGIGSIYSFRPENGNSSQRPSSVKLALTFTQLKQTIACFIPEMYFNNEKYLVNGYYCYYKYPDKFWGIGSSTADAAEEDYVPSHLKTFTNFQKKIAPGLYVGIRHQLEYIELIDTDENGILKDKIIAGSENGIAAGLGFIVNYDTRNNIYFPTSGNYFQIFNTFFDDSFGGDYTFRLLNVDLRKYFSLSRDKHVLAVQTYNTFIHGTPPFQMMALLGGSYWMRGYFFGRYRDKNMMTVQAEYRFPIYWRFGGVAFAGAGDVADRFDTFKFNLFKYSFGFGLRFMFDAKEKINARLDIGFGENGKSGMYVMVLEAF